MYMVTIRLRCSDGALEDTRCETDLRLRIEAVVSVALLDLFTDVGVEGVSLEGEAQSPSPLQPSSVCLDERS